MKCLLQHTGQSNLVRQLFILCRFMLLTCSFLIMTNASAAEVIDYNIPAGPMSKVLTQFGADSDLLLSFEPAMTANKNSNGLQGQYTVEEALQFLLEDTGLDYRISSDNTISLIKIPIQSNSINLVPIVVEGDRIGRTTDETAPSVLVIDGADADNGINRDLRESVDAVANVVYEEGPYLAAIRGIDGTGGVEGSTSITAGSQPRVPIIIDGISLPTAIGATISTTGLWDTQTIEVARGPQATTTGRNAIGGAIRVFTNDPTYETELAIRGGYFDQDGTANGALMANLPIIDKNLAFRLAAEISRGDAYVEPGFAAQAALADDIDNERLTRVRGKLLFTPRSLPDLSMIVGLDHQRLQTTFDPGAIDRNQDSLILNAVGKYPLEEERTSHTIDIKYKLSEHFELEQRFALLDSNVISLPNAGFRPETAFDVNKKINDTLIRFNDLGWIDRGFIGYSYEGQREDISDATQVVNGTIDNHGIFGELEIGVMDHLTLLLGGRYENDSRSRAIEQFALAFNESNDTSEDVFLPKIGVRYEVTPDLISGYTYSEGFRASGIDFNIFSGAPFFIPGPNAATFDSELLKQHEAFIKGLISSNLSIGISIFYYTFEDSQVLGADPSAPFLIGNLPEACGFGGEIEGLWTPTDYLSISGGVGLLDTEITDDGGSGFEGSELARAPNVTANGSLNWRFAPGWNFTGDIRYVGSQTYRLGGVDIGKYTVGDVSVAYNTNTSAGDIYVEGFIKNVGDARYETRDFDGGLFVNARTVGRPRTFGLTTTLRF